MKNRCIVLSGFVVIASGCSAVPLHGDFDSVDLAVSAGTTYNFKLPQLTNSCLDVNGAGTADGTNIQEWGCNGSGAQSFRTDNGAAGGYFKLVNTNSGKCVDVSANGTADGTNIQLWTCNGSSAQDFQFQSINGYNKIVGRNSGKCVDVNANNSSNGTNVQLWTCNGTGAQTWNPVSTSGGGTTTTGGGTNCAVYAHGSAGPCGWYTYSDCCDPCTYGSTSSCPGAGGGTTTTGGGGGGGSGIGGVVSSNQFSSWFPSRNSFYTYSGLTSINSKYADFSNSSDMTIRKREAAAFLANMALETGNLVYVVEQNTANYCSYCDASQPYGCPAGQCAYYGKGPIQLSWNFNYKAAGDALGYDLLHNPGWVASDANISWQTAAWYWNTQAGGYSTTSHNAMLNSNGSGGFGFTIKAINGGIECPSVGGTNSASRDTRINNYRFFCDQLGVSYGNNISC